MKVFNQGARRFKVYDLYIEPGKFTTIPADVEGRNYSTHVEKLLKDYPTEIVTDAAALDAGRAKDNRIAELEREVAELKGQIAKLQRVASGAGEEDPATGGASTPEETAPAKTSAPTPKKR